MTDGTGSADTPFRNAFFTDRQHTTQPLGELAQLGERLVCNQEVTGSSPVFSTNLRSRDAWLDNPPSAASFGWQAKFGRRRLRAEARCAKADKSFRGAIPRMIFDN